MQLHMLGYPVDFASFYILEVMSRTEFAHKRVGYLAAGQVFSPTTDVLLLTTNLFKKVRWALLLLVGGGEGRVAPSAAGRGAKRPHHPCLFSGVSFSSHLATGLIGGVSDAY